MINIHSLGVSRKSPLLIGYTYYTETDQSDSVHEETDQPASIHEEINTPKFNKIMNRFLYINEEKSVLKNLINQSIESAYLKEKAETKKNLDERESKYFYLNIKNSQSENFNLIVDQSGSTNEDKTINEDTGQFYDIFPSEGGSSEDLY